MQQPKRIENIKKFQNFFNSADGDFAMKEIDKLCGYKVDTFSPDPHLHAYNAGRKSVAVEIHNILELKESEDERQV